jgi:hypothetical protein
MIPKFIAKIRFGFHALEAKPEARTGQFMANPEDIIDIILKHQNLEPRFHLAYETNRYQGNIAMGSHTSTGFF